MEFNTPKAGPLSCVTSPIEKEKIKIVILSILNLLDHIHRTRAVLYNIETICTLKCIDYLDLRPFSSLIEETNICIGCSKMGITNGWNLGLRTRNLEP